MVANYTLLKQYVISVFESIGCSEQDATLAADVLVSADARGIDSHGVARLAGYIRLFDHGRLNPKPNIKKYLEFNSIYFGKEMNKPGDR